VLQVGVVEAKLNGQPIDPELFSHLVSFHSLRAPSSRFSPPHAMLQSLQCKNMNAQGDGRSNVFWQSIQVHLLCAAFSPSPEEHLKSLMDFVVSFVHRHKKTSSDAGVRQELAFCANFSMFLNAALRIRNVQKMPPQPPIFPAMSKKLTGLDPSTSLSLQKMVFSGQVFGGCGDYGNFYASHSIENSQEDPKLWQKLGLMIACCGEEPEETCMQRFCDSVIDHPDIGKLRKWQHAWVNSKRDHFHSHRLTAALTASAAGSAIHTEFEMFKHKARDMYTQIGLELDNSEKRRLLVQLAKFTLEWAKKELPKAHGQASKRHMLECLKRPIYDHHLCGGKIFTPFLEEGDSNYGHWSFSDSGISLSEVAELYGLFKAAEASDYIDFVSEQSDELKRGDPATCSVAARNLLDLLLHLKRCFQECFWPPLSPGHVALSAGEVSKHPFYLMQTGLWNEWTAAGPMRACNIIPQLLEDILGCCSALREISLDLLVMQPHPDAPVDQSFMREIAALFRRVHDTVYAPFTRYSALASNLRPCIFLTSSCSGKASRSTSPTEVA
jgi:hypothetical protein